jgi:ribosomal-protein-alanine N-acetyltransferase
MTVPEFYTERLFIRGVRVEDAASYELGFADYEVIKHLAAQVPWPYPKGGALDYIENFLLPAQGENRWSWVLFEKNDVNKVIGCIELWRKGQPEHRGFWLAKDYWGKGYMTEAVEPITDYAFSELDFDKLIFANAVGNARSRRVKEKVGAILIGIEPAKFVSPEYTEHELWELTKEKWEENKSGN